MQGGGCRGCAGRWRTAGLAFYAAPSRCDGTTESTAGQTGRRRNTDPGTARSLLRCDPAWPLVRIGGVFPGAGPLERDPLTAQDLPQPLPADLHPAGRITGQIVGELANTPVRERAAQLARTRLGRRNDVRDVIVGDAAGTAPPPPHVPAAHTPPSPHREHL